MSDTNTTRTTLLKTALDLFAAQGYDGVGVQQICDSVGVGKPTLYHYFGSKRGLLETLLEEQLAPLHKALDDAAAQEDFDKSLTALAAETFAFARSMPLLYRFYLTLWFAPVDSEARKVAQVYHERHFDIIDARFRAHEEAAGASRGQHKMLAASFLGMINNHIGIALNSFVSLNAALAEQSVEMFLHGALPTHQSGGK